MSQFTLLTLKDASDAAVAFANSRIDYATGVATWLRAGATYDLQHKATFSLTLPNAKTTRGRLKVKVTIPVLNTAGDTKVDELTFNGELVMPKTSSDADRNLLLAYAKSFLAVGVVGNAVDKFEGVY